MNKKKKVKVSQLVLGGALGAYALACLLPLILVIVVSFTDDNFLMKNGFSFFPKQLSLDGWRYVFSFGNQLLVSYKVTIIVTIVGTCFSVIVMSMYAYAMSRKCFSLRGFLAIVMLIPMLFSGGTLSTYIITTRYYGLRDSLWALILPGVSTMYIIIFRTYIINSIPEALIDSAKIDGAGEFRTYWNIILPCMKPALASVGFMVAIGYWNEWNKAYMYITSASKTPLQLLLIKIEKNIAYLLENDTLSGTRDSDILNELPFQSGRMAIMIFALGPILVAYPFFQKYFVKGLTVGAVKG